MHSLFQGACNVPGLARSRLSDPGQDHRRAVCLDCLAGTLFRVRQVFQLLQSDWSRGVRVRLKGQPTQELAFRYPLRSPSAVPFF